MAYIPRQLMKDAMREVARRFTSYDSLIIKKASAKPVTNLWLKKAPEATVAKTVAHMLLEKNAPKCIAKFKNFSRLA